MNPEARQALLRRFEPVVRYTKGEQFFPTDVDLYVRACSLWTQRSDEKPECLVPEGELTLEKLAEQRSDHPGAVHFMKFIDPLNISELAAYRLEQSRARRRKAGDVFRAGRGRLARVGYLPRLLDMLFSLTLMARGRVPGDTAAAAAVTYHRMIGERGRPCYYGRVLRQNGWTVLQYWFFYPFNNWRSGFFGLNDHEADWEMICVYLYESGEDLRPEWVAYASHDFSGDDLRRRWDDPEVQKMGEHPVIYTAAGSHASYYAPGEYLAELDLPFLSPAVRLAGWLQQRWRATFRQYRGEETEPGGDPHVFRVPFVDYARGDGVSIGPGTESAWGEACLLDPLPAWAANYRGLWGLYANDPVAGEDAPAGPRYERDGTVRRSWYDPVGWAGLDKVPPPDRALAHVLERLARAEERCRELETATAEKSRELAGLGLEAAALRGRPQLEKLREDHEKKVAEVSGKLARMRASLASGRTLVETLKLQEGRIRAGDRGAPREHIRRPHRPASQTRLRFDRLAEAWAAVSIALMMIGFVALILFARQYLVFGLVALISVLVFVESGFRRQLIQLTTSVTLGLAVVSSLILLYELFWQIVVAAVLAAAAYMVWENLRELWT